MAGPDPECKVPLTAEQDECLAWGRELSQP
jgi:hypothetical protein